MSFHAVFAGAAGSADGAGADAEGAAGAADGAAGASTGAGAALGGAGGAVSASGCVPPHPVRRNPKQSASAEERIVVMGEKTSGAEDAL